MPCIPTKETHGKNTDYMTTLTNPLPSSSAAFNRPGVSDSYLAAAGVHHVGEDECANRYGFRAAGTAIPYHDTRGELLVEDDGKPFARVRLYDATTDQKYHQRPKSSVHIYIPPGFRERSKGSTMIVIEGEFKAASLDVAGYCAVGIGGINGACQNGELHHELVEALQYHRPGTVIFAGDSDVVLNVAFAIEAAKLGRILRGSKKFTFIESVRVAKCPLCGPKGFDDCRGEQGDQFNAWFDALLSVTYSIPAKASADEIFCDLLTREAEPVKAALSGQDHEARRARLRLLQSAAQLWKEPAAVLSLKPLLAKVLDVGVSEMNGLVRDAGPKEQAIAEITADASRVTFPELESWPHLVDLAGLLNQIATTIERFVVGSQDAIIAASLYIVFTFTYDTGDTCPIFFITGPTKRCGKSRLLAIMLRLVRRAFAASSATPPGIYRVIELHHPTLGIDEVDAFVAGDEQLRGLVNSGHTRDAAFHLGCVVSGDDWEPRRFSTWTPKIFSGIGKLADTIEDRAIIVRMVRKRAGEPCERLRHGMTFDDIPRKALRWLQDHEADIRGCDPKIPDGLNDRAADNWTPLFVLADLAGGEWPERARKAALALSGGDDGEALGLTGQLLADVRGIFEAEKLSKIASKELAALLAGIEGRPWAEFGKHRKAISVNQLANLLRGFGVTSRTIRTGDTTSKGYDEGDFAEAFDRYLPGNSLAKGNNVTLPANIERNGDLQNVTQGECDVSENATLTNKDAGCDVVTFQKQENEAAKLL
jgi:putative DNA primase/helicase